MFYSPWLPSTYDVYCAAALQKEQIIAYALPEHTSGKAKACDIVLFNALKNAIKRVLNDTVDAKTVHQLTMYELCAMMKCAYVDLQTPGNIISTFQRSRLHPFKPSRLLDVARPRDGDGNDTILSPEQFTTKIDEKSGAVREIFWVLE